jgi:type II secretory pathway component PulF
LILVAVGYVLVICPIVTVVPDFEMLFEADVMVSPSASATVVNASTNKMAKVAVKIFFMCIAP